MYEGRGGFDMQEKKKAVRRGISRRSFLKQAGVSAAIGLLGGLPRRVSAAEEIPVGSLLDATGAINVYGLPMIDSTRMTIDDINAKGGVLGRPLKLIEYDTQSTNDLYVQYATELIVKHKVAVVMGGITSASREAIRPTVIDRYKTLYFYNEQYEGGVADKLVFCTGVVPEQQLETLIPWAIKEFGSKVYTIAADYNYGWISAAWVKFYCKKYEGQVVGEEFIPLEISEFSTTLAKIQAAKPDFILSLLVGGNHIACYRQWAAAGLKEKFPIVSATYGLGNEQVVLGPKEGEGIYVTYPYFQELDNPENRKFVAMWHKRYGDNYPYITDSANVVWTGWHLWAKAVNMAGSLETDKVIAALESGLEFDAPEGKVKMDPSIHHLIHNVYLGRGNRTHGFDIVKEFGPIVPTWHKETFNLIKNPNLRKQFTPEVT
jgi:branched-chain amino acid transport system substrate-binding protein